MLLIQVMQIQLERTTIKDNNTGRRHKQREREKESNKERIDGQQANN